MILGGFDPRLGGFADGHEAVVVEQIELVGIEAVEHGVALNFAKLGQHGWVDVVGEDADREERLAVDQRDAFGVERDAGPGGRQPRRLAELRRARRSSTVWRRVATRNRRGGFLNTSANSIFNSNIP